MPYQYPPVYFLEFDGYKFIPEPTIPNAAIDYSAAVTLLVLPTGQILETDGTKDVEIYTPDDTAHRPSWNQLLLKPLQL